MVHIPNISWGILIQIADHAYTANHYYIHYLTCPDTQTFHRLSNWYREYILHDSVSPTETVLCITVSLVPLRTSSMNGFEWVSEDEVVLWHSRLRYSGQLSGIFDVSMPLPWQQMQTKFLCPWFLTSLLQESEIHYIIAIHSLLYKLMQRHSIHRSSKCSFDCGFFVLIH